MIRRPFLFVKKKKKQSQLCKKIKKGVGEWKKKEMCGFMTKEWTHRDRKSQIVRDASEQPCLHKPDFYSHLRL